MMLHRSYDHLIIRTLSNDDRTIKFAELSSEMALQLERMKRSAEGMLYRNENVMERIKEENENTHNFICQLKDKIFQINFDE